MSYMIKKRSIHGFMVWVYSKNRDLESDAERQLFSTSQRLQPTAPATTHQERREIIDFWTNPLQSPLEYLVYKQLAYCSW